MQFAFTPMTHRWEWFNGVIPANAIFTDPNYAVIRAEHAGDWVIGKYSVGGRQAYIPWGGQEVQITGGFEVLVHAPGTHVKWVPASHGQVVGGAIGPVGKEGIFVGRAVCPQPENKYTPGKVHPSHQCIYIPWGGQEHKILNYEVCVIESDYAHYSSGIYHWEKLNKHMPLLQNTVYTDPKYAVIRTKHNGDWVLGKYCTSNQKSYIPYGNKEIEVKGDVEYLIHAPGTSVYWVPASHGAVPEGAVGPFGAEQLFVGRALSPKDEGKYTPGKISTANKTFYLPYKGKEHRHENYEALVIKYSW